jgi:hypothetical protein
MENVGQLSQKPRGICRIKTGWLKIMSAQKLLYSPKKI